MAVDDSLLERLFAARVEFVLVGGYAAVAHGVSMVTADIDICLPFSPENVGRLEKALDGLHPVHRLTPQKIPFEPKSLNIADLKNLYLSTDLGVLDCLGEVLGLGGYEAVKAQSVEVTLSSGNCRILNIPALIRAKEAMGRPHDLLTITQLKAIQEKISS